MAVIDAADTAEVELSYDSSLSPPWFAEGCDHELRK